MEKTFTSIEDCEEFYYIQVEDKDIVQVTIDRDTLTVTWKEYDDVYDR